MPATPYDEPGGVDAKAQLPVTKTLSVYGEGGLGIITRKGFQIDQSTALTDANYSTPLFGGGVQYRVTDNWSLVLGTTSAAHAEARNREPQSSRGIQSHDASASGRRG